MPLIPSLLMEVAHHARDGSRLPMLHAMRTRGNTNNIDDEFGRRLCWERCLSFMIYNSLVPAAAAGLPSLPIL